MTVSRANFAHNQQLSTTATNIISPVPTGVISTPWTLSFTNTSTTTARLVSVYIVEDGGTADTGTSIASKSIQPGKAWVCTQALNENFTAGMSLKADQDVGTDVNVNCSGVNEST